MHLVLIGPFHPYRGGIAQFMEAMHVGMMHRSHQVDAVTFRRQYPDLLFPGKTQYAEQDDPSAPHPPRLLDSIDPISWGRTARAVARMKPDAVLFKFWMPFFAPSFGTVARYLSRRGVRILAVVDNAIPHERHLGDAVLSRFFLGACDGCIVMSDSVETDIRRLGVETEIRKVRHPVYNQFGDPVDRSSARSRLGLSPDAPVLLFFGFVRRYKGIHVLLDAMPAIVERLPGVRLVIAGEFYEDETACRRRIEEHGLEKHVHVHADYIPEDDVAVYFSAADVVVQPYLSATQSGVAMAAFHFDRPLIVTSVGGLPEVVPDNEAGIVVPPGDPDALADAVVRYFTAGLAPALTAGVREQKARYSWDRLFEAIEDLAEDG